VSRLVWPLIVVLLAGCVQAPLQGASTTRAASADGLAPKLFEGVKFLAFDTTSSTGDVVHAQAWVPDKPLAGGAPTTFPTILIASPYWGGGSDGTPTGYMPYDYWIKAGVPRGYAVVHGDNAGNGGSGGCWDFMGPAERAATYALVEGIAKQPWSDGKVGMIGISYDGMTQIMASTQAPPHLTTVVPVEALTSSYAGLYMNGVHYGGAWMGTTTSYEEASLAPPGLDPLAGPPRADPSRAPGYAQRLPESPQCLAQNTAMGNDPTGADNAYYKDRDYRAKAGDVRASVFLVQGFFDPAVKPDNAWPFFDDLKVPKKAWFGFWFHQFPNASASGRTDMYPTLQRWFDHELLGVDNGIDKEPVVDVQDSSGQWRHEATWPPPDAAPATYYVGPKDLATAPAAPGSLSFGGALQVAATVGQAAGVAVASAPLAAPLHVAGSILFHGSVASSSAGGNVLLRLYDRAPDGSMRMVTQGVQNLQLAGGLDAASPLTPGQAVKVGFALYPTDWVVPEGHSIVLTFQEQDPTEWYAPDPYAAQLTVTLGGADGARLVVPTIERPADATFLVACGAPLKLATCDHDGAKDDGVPT
jgi:predicted acyl esterase